MSIQANNIQYSGGNIQTCSLVIDSKVYQIQYQDGSYKVSSSGESTSESGTQSQQPTNIGQNIGQGASTTGTPETTGTGTPETTGTGTPETPETTRRSKTTKKTTKPTSNNNNGPISARLVNQELDRQIEELRRKKKDVDI